MSESARVDGENERDGGEEMPEFKIILVGTEYPMNLGYCARVLANFGYQEMHIVKPKAKVGKTAIMYAKHGRALLENARTYANLEEAVKDCKFVVGTTGVLKRGKKTLRNPLNLEQFIERTRKREGRFAVLFGREGIGLTSDEISRCDLLVSIPADRRYPVLNLSHALAIVLYGVSRTREYGLIKHAKSREKEELIKTFSEITDFFRPQLRNPEKIKVAFRRVVGRALVSEVEAAGLLCVMKKAREASRDRMKSSARAVKIKRS